MIENVDAGMGMVGGRMVNELLHTQSLAGQRQVISTTSSSSRLNWIEPKDYGTVFTFTRDNDAGATEVSSVSQLAKTQRSAGAAGRPTRTDARVQLGRKRRVRGEQAA